MNASGSVDVPDVVEPHITEAKLVCEQIVLGANELFGVKTSNLKTPLLRTSSVRFGQLTGPLVRIPNPHTPEDLSITTNRDPTLFFATTLFCRE